MRGCRCCGLDGIWTDVAKLSAEPQGPRITIVLQPRSRSIGIRLFGREFVVGHFKHLAVGLVDEEMA